MAKGPGLQHRGSHLSNMGTILPDENELELIETDNISDLPFPGLVNTRCGSMLSLAVSDPCVTNNNPKKHSADSRPSCSVDSLNCNRNVKVCWDEHKDEHSRNEEGKDQEGKSTITRGLLSTSGFVWMPACTPNGRCDRTLSLADEWFADAQKCSRMYLRRNALADPNKMIFPQATRERIEKEVAARKSSLTRKISQIFRSVYSKNYEEDLI